MDGNSVLPGVTNNTDKDNQANPNVLSEQIPGASEEKASEKTTVDHLSGNVDDSTETETTPPSLSVNHDTGPPSSPLLRNYELEANKNTEVEMDIQTRPFPEMAATVNTTAEPMDVDINNELTEPDETLLGITETGNGIYKYP